MNLDILWKALAGHLSPSGAAWLAAALNEIAQDRRAIRLLFPAAGRKCGRGPLLDGWTVDDAVRAVLLSTVSPAEATAVYRDGDATERRAVLRALPLLDIGDTALVEDALRANDTRLIAAAMGPCARELAQPAWRHGVLKCVFVGIPLDHVADLDERVDDELVRMMRDYAEERLAAGRPVPTDVSRLCRER